MSVHDIEDWFYRSRAQAILDELGEERFRLFLTMVDYDLPSPVIAKALGVPLWWPSVNVKLVARHQYRVFPELRDMVKRSPIRVVAVEQQKEKRA